MSHRLHAERCAMCWYFKTGAVSRNFCAAHTTARASDFGHRHHPLRRPETIRRDGCDRSGTYLHDVARREEIRRHDHYFGSARRIPQGLAYTRRSHGANNGKGMIRSNNWFRTLPIVLLVTATAGFALPPPPSLWSSNISEKL